MKSYLFMKDKEQIVKPHIFVLFWFQNFCLIRLCLYEKLACYLLLTKVRWGITLKGPTKRVKRVFWESSFNVLCFLFLKFDFEQKDELKIRFIFIFVQWKQGQCRPNKIFQSIIFSKCEGSIVVSNCFITFDYRYYSFFIACWIFFIIL